MNPDYSFQDKALIDIEKARIRRVNRLLATSPTGSGKGNIIARLVDDELDRGGRTIVYSNRRVVIDQISERLVDRGIEFGFRASGKKPNLSLPVQISSIDTERHRSLNKYHPWEIYNATLVLVDEAHSNKAATARRILDAHEKQGAFIVGLTATPVDLGFKYETEDGTERRMYDELLVMARQSEMRKAGVLVGCLVYAPNEIDCSDLDVTNSTNDYSSVKVQQRFNNVKWTVVGSVIETMRELNPELYGIVLFPPGVPESRWFVSQLKEQGISAVHIDADTTSDDRQAAFRDHKDGDISVICSYGVIAEGWDAPWARHCVFCRPTISPTVYIQIVGRVLRAYPGKEHAILQDHVGAWWKPGLGSPNQDREWKMEDTNGAIVKTVKEAREFPDDFDKKEEKQEGARCPKCNMILKHRPSEGFVCKCGHTFKRSQRMIIERDGKLVRRIGRATKKKPVRDDTYFYRKAVFQAANSGRTVGQTYGLACILKSKHLGIEKAKIDTDKVKLFVPSRDSDQWHRKACVVYPWGVQQRKPKDVEAPY